MFFDTSDGSIIHYKRKGTGEPIIFIHGLGSSLHSWNYHFRQFCRDYDTLAYDCRGHGRSTIPAKLTMQDHIQDAYELACQFNKPVNIIGVSMGGYIAQGLLLQYPEIIKKVILISTKAHGGISSTLSTMEITEGNIDSKQLRFHFLRNYIFGPDFSNEKIMKFIELETPLSIEQDNLQRNAIGEFDFRLKLKSCQQNALIIHGDHDKLIPPKYGEEIAEILLNSKYVLIPGGGHSVITEKTYEVNKAIAEFLLS